MWSREEHIEGFCRAFLVEEKRERLVKLLLSKRRAAAVAELAHSDYVAEGCRRDVNQADQNTLLQRLEKQGVGGETEVYLISNYEELDDRSMQLRGALEEVLGIGLGTVISIVPGRLAVFEGEYGIEDRFLLVIE